MCPETHGNAVESATAPSAPASTPEDPLSQIYIPQGKSITRVDYEIRQDRLRGETVVAATLFFSDGSELWVDLSANAGRVALTHPAP